MDESKAMMEDLAASISALFQPKTETFSGLKYENFNNFIRNFEDAISLSEAAKKNQIQLLVKALRGKAKLYFDTILRKDYSDGKLTYEQLVSALRKKFSEQINAIEKAKSFWQS